MIQNRFLLVGLGMMVCFGCASVGVSTAGSREAAEEYYAAEFQKWMGGQPSSVTTFDFRLSDQKPPVGHRILTTTPESADMLAVGDTNQPMDVWGKWKSYRMLVEIEFLSEAGSPIKKVIVYTLCWDDVHDAWIVKERF